MIITDKTVESLWLDEVDTSTPSLFRTSMIEGGERSKNVQTAERFRTDPPTLLAQVDAAIGGKAGLNLIGINMIGTPGIGFPHKRNLEADLSQALMEIPYTKGVEFGARFELTKMKGSEANDEFHIKNNKIRTKTNDLGDTLGGISTGMPLIARVGFKTTPSIYKPQKKVGMEDMREDEIQLEGRLPLNTTSSRIKDSNCIGRQTIKARKLELV